MLPLHWFLLTPCGICSRPLASSGATADPLCSDCRQRFALPPGGLHGDEPIAWWGAGFYGGPFRELLLSLRHRPRAAVVEALISSLAAQLLESISGRGTPLLVPIPSWKRQANPLPGLICQSLSRRTRLRRTDLLERSRPVLGQHHLRRELRLSNQIEAFRCPSTATASGASARPLLIVDDILTSGATACSAAACLRQAGWQVQGMVCLARTPWGRRAVP
ncbi:MAG: ComF family protein [Cyanobium sp.]